MNKMLLKILSVISYISMVAVNLLANALPINGIPTGVISDSYPNLFAPIGLTFSIWGLIYVLLLIYVVYQFLPKSKNANDTIQAIAPYFIASSVLNFVWIFSWHYRLISVSVLLMIALLVSLIQISRISNKYALSLKEKLLIKVPFGVYFGWITVATIANITTLLVSLGWKDVLFPDQVWMILILIIGASIASITASKERNVAYGLVPVWAYFGIYLKHTSQMYFNSAYPAVIITTVVCISALVVVNVYLLLSKKAL